MGSCYMHLDQIPCACEMLGIDSKEKCANLVNKCLLLKVTAGRVQSGRV